jgi:hypothetical protein
MFGKSEGLLTRKERKQNHTVQNRTQQQDKKDKHCTKQTKW